MKKNGYLLLVSTLDNTKAIVGTAVAVGTITAAGLAYLYSKKVDETIPTKYSFHFFFYIYL